VDVFELPRNAGSCEDLEVQPYGVRTWRERLTDTDASRLGGDSVRCHNPTRGGPVPATEPGSTAYRAETFEGTHTST
jgi:hypothetical protein